MVFADAENVETDLVGQLDLLEQIADASGFGAGGAISRIWVYFDKTIDTDLHW